MATGYEVEGRLDKGLRAAAWMLLACTAAALLAVGFWTTNDNQAAASHDARPAAGGSR